MTNRAKRIFLFFGILTAVICACLGLETQHSNHLGWALLFAGAGLTTAGCIYLGGSSMVQEEERQTHDRSLWLPCLGALLISLVTPLEYLYLPEVLPRNDEAQDIGIIMSAGGLAFYLLSLRAPHPWRSQANPAARGTSAILRLALHPFSAGLLLFLLALGIGYSSLIGLALILVLVLPGLFRVTR